MSAPVHDSGIRFVLEQAPERIRAQQNPKLIQFAERFRRN